VAIFAIKSEGFDLFLGQRGEKNPSARHSRRRNTLWNRNSPKEIAGWAETDGWGRSFGNGPPAWPAELRPILTTRGEYA